MHAQLRAVQRDDIASAFPEHYETEHSTVMLSCIAEMKGADKRSWQQPFIYLLSPLSLSLSLFLTVLGCGSHQ